MVWNGYLGSLLRLGTFIRAIISGLELTRFFSVYLSQYFAIIFSGSSFQSCCLPVHSLINLSIISLSVYNSFPSDIILPVVFFKYHGDHKRHKWPHLRCTALNYVSFNKCSAGKIAGNFHALTGQSYGKFLYHFPSPLK